MKLLNIFIKLLVSTLLLVGCQTFKGTTPLVVGKSIPTTYNQISDSTNAAQLTWRQYFHDTLLISLLDTAMNNNFDLLIAYQRINFAKAGLMMAKGKYLPTVTTNGSLGLKRFGEYTSDGVGNYDTKFSQNIRKDQIIPEHLPDFYLGLQSSWEVDIWGKLKSKKKAALAHYLASVEGKNYLITSLVAEVANQYFELLALDMELEILRETINLQNNQLSIILLEKEAGRANELAVKQFEAQVLNSKSLEVGVTQEIIEAENRINALLGRFPQTIKRNKNILFDYKVSMLNVGVPADLLENRPDIRKAEYEVRASKANVKAAKAAFYPSLNIVAGVGFQSFNPKFFIDPRSLAYNVLGGLVAPLINKSAIRSEFVAANATQVETLYNYQKTVLNAYIEVYNQLNYTKNLNLMFTYKGDEVERLNSAINTASELYRTGRATYLEIIITRQNALQSRLQLVQIKKRQYDAQVNLYKALGGGWR
jgi:outer membrane protein, multidrug efflux system